MNKYPIILFCCLIGFQAAAQKKTDSNDKTDKGKIIALNKKTVRLVNRDFDASNVLEKGVIALDSREGDGLAILQNVRMNEGTLHIDLKGENKPGSSFVGIAFNIQNDSTYEAVYFRPFNFLSDEKIRRTHGIQYIYHPVFTWNKLRKEREGVFEREFANPPSPDGWFSISLTVTPDKVLVKEVKTGKHLMEVERLAKPTSEKIGFWVGNGSEGSFKNLIVLE